jgi:hypothetical protein
MYVLTSQENLCKCQCREFAFTQRFKVSIYIVKVKSTFHTKQSIMLSRDKEDGKLII